VKLACYQDAKGTIDGTTAQSAAEQLAAEAAHAARKRQAAARPQCQGPGDDGGSSPHAPHRAGESLRTDHREDVGRAQRAFVGPSQRSVREMLPVV